jgi:hypothetical protein
MHARTSVAIVVAAAVLGLTTPLHAQSLADLAKKADDQKKAAKGTKTYTNKDVGDVPPATAGSPTVSATGATDPTAKPATGSTTAATDKTATGDKTDPAAAATPAGGAKDQAYYSGRIKELRGKLDRDTAFAAALQSQINGLQADFINRDDPAQKAQIEQNRNKALAQQAQLNKDIAADKKAIADFEEEARKAGAPPGWLR